MERIIILLYFLLLLVFIPAVSAVPIGGEVYFYNTLASPCPSTLGEPVTFIVHLKTFDSHPILGYVKLYDEYELGIPGKEIGSAEIINETAIVTVNDLTLGSHEIWGSYDCIDGYYPDEPNLDVGIIYIQTVEKDISELENLGVNINLQSSPTSPIEGGTVTINAVIKPSNQYTTLPVEGDINVLEVYPDNKSVLPGGFNQNVEIVDNKASVQIPSISLGEHCFKVNFLPLHYYEMKESYINVGVISAIAPVYTMSIYSSPNPSVTGESVHVIVNVYSTDNGITQPAAGGDISIYERILNDDNIDTYGIGAGKVVNGVCDTYITPVELGDNRIYVLYFASDGGGTSQFFYQEVRTVAGIPEFPTIALPAATILGLLLLFGRKND